MALTDDSSIHGTDIDVGFDEVQAHPLRGCCRGRKPMSPEEEERIVELYAAGRSTRQIAEAIGRSRAGIRRVLRRRGVRVRPRGVAYTRCYGSAESHRLHVETVRLYQEGFTQRQVAELMGCCGATVSNRLKAAGVPARGRSRRPPPEPDLGRVSPGPLVELLERIKEEAEIPTYEALAGRFGISDRTLREWREDAREVNVLTADRVLTRAGVLWHDVFDAADPVARLAFTGEA